MVTPSVTTPTFSHALCVTPPSAGLLCPGCPALRGFQSPAPSSLEPLLSPRPEFQGVPLLFPDAVSRLPISGAPPSEDSYIPSRDSPEQCHLRVTCAGLRSGNRASSSARGGGQAVTRPRCPGAWVLLLSNPGPPGRADAYSPCSLLTWDTSRRADDLCDSLCTSTRAGILLALTIL